MNIKFGYRKYYLFDQYLYTLTFTIISVNSTLKPTYFNFREFYNNIIMEIKYF